MKNDLNLFQEVFLRLKKTSVQHEVAQKKVTDSFSAYEALSIIYDAEEANLYEIFYVMYLNNDNRVIGYYRVSQGGFTGTIVDPRLVFAGGLQVGAVSMILSHCHPSGKLYPSEADKFLTRKLKKAGKLLDIKVLDHIIFTSNGFYSFANEGTL